MSAKPHLNRRRECTCVFCGESREARSAFFNGLKMDFKLLIRDEIAEMMAPATASHENSRLE